MLGGEVNSDFIYDDPNDNKYIKTFEFELS